jgi:serralysin
MTSTSSGVWAFGDADADDSSILKAGGGGLLISEPMRTSPPADGVTTSEPVRPFESASSTGGNLFAASGGGIVTSDPVLPFGSSSSTGGSPPTTGSGGIMTSEPVRSFGPAANIGSEDGNLLTSGPTHTLDLGIYTGDTFSDLLMTGSDVLTTWEPVRAFDASIITDAGESFNAVRNEVTAGQATADAAGGNTASASTLATIQTIGTYIASSSPTSAGGRHFAAGSNVTVNLTGLLLAGELMYARTALAAWARVANIHFIETTGAAQITMTDDNDAINPNAYTSTSWNNATTISSASIHITQWWYNNNGGAGGPTNVLNGYGYQTYVHELGHALGLGHDGPYNGSATYGLPSGTSTNIFTNDSWQFSTMSYFDQTNYGGASYAYITSAMQADIYAMQLLYGAPTTDPGTYKFGYGANTGSEFDLAQVNSFCMYSVNGTADLDASLYGGAQTVNFSAGTFSSIKGLTNNISTALNTHLTKYEGGLGVDTVYFGNAVNGARTATGGAGNDVFIANGTSDSVNSITVDGGTGIDSFTTQDASTGYTFKHLSQANNTWQISKNGSAYETLSNIETLNFSDRSFSLKSSAARDLTGDATSDIIWYNASSGIANYFTMNNGAVASWNLAGAVNPTWTAVASADFDGNGSSDILYRRATDGAIGYLSQTGGAWTWNSAGGVDKSWSVAGCADIDGNGRGDIVYTNAAGNVGYLSMTGSVGSWHSLGGLNSSWAVKGVGDFNFDGHDDILYYNQTAGSAGYLDYNGLWHNFGSAIASSWTAVGVGDFNGDGTADVLMYNQSFGGAFNYWAMDRNGNATWSAINGLGAVGTDWAVKGVGDYNGDGMSDIVIYNATLAAAGLITTHDNAPITWNGLGAVSPAWQIL